MKILLTLIATVCWAGAAVGQQPTPAPKPGPEHQKLGIWLGDWTYEGEAKDSPLGPGGRFSGKYTARPILGGFFVEFRGEETGPTGSSYGVEIDGYDAVNKRYTWNGFTSDGYVSAVTYTLDGPTMSYSGTAGVGAKQCQIRGTVVFAADFLSYVDKVEYSTDGTTWQPLAGKRATKVARPAATAAHKILMFIRDDPSPQLEYMLIHEVSAMRGILKESGFEVALATISGAAIQADWITVTPDLKLSDVKIDDYAGFVLPCTATDTMPAQAVSFVQSIVSRRKPLAAQMGAVHVLGKAGVLDGKKFAFADEKDDNVGMFP